MKSNSARAPGSHRSSESRNAISGARDRATPRFRLTPRHFAYLKIAEGCNHPCSFCIIPRIRGTHRSRPLDDLVHEARQLLAEVRTRLGQEPPGQKE